MGAAAPDDGKGEGVTKKPAAAGASVLLKPTATGVSVLTTKRMGRLGNSRRGGGC